jgi:hypothetical protein
VKRAGKATCGVVKGVEAARGTDRTIGAAHVVVWGASVVQGAVAGAEVPATGEVCGAMIGETMGLSSNKMSKPTGGGLPGESKGEDSDGR